MSLSDSIREETAIARAWYGHPFRFMARVLASSVPVDAGDGQNKGHVTFAAPKSLKTANLTIRKGTRLRSREHPTLEYRVMRVDGDVVTFRPYRRRGRVWRMTVSEIENWLEGAEL